MSNPFKTGDLTEFVKRDVEASWYMTHRNEYIVTSVSGVYVRVVNDSGSEDGYHFSHFHLVAATTAAKSPHATFKATAQLYNKGDKVNVTVVYSDITKGKVYSVGEGFIGGVFLKDDAGDKRFMPNGDLRPASTLTEVTEVDEPSYEQRKASANVTSAGIFNIGDVLVYRDGTPTATSLTVAYCTATCIRFEETYSTPFNPDEFTMENYDDY